ncbi:DUF1838-domain-containing protein [Hesseltinella vesiculosa]|uniref:DUF1838-domain-containing protein n=1 Tax=Hesseltinella vesiculosa TaxID=101127 RepID=A0A1X2GM49_9FUNG|nr:DUF1838-domain-containing protein [Hesseltinella vesiculosa]
MSNSSDSTFTVGNTFPRLRYSTDPTAETFFEWEGSAFVYLPDEPPKKVFSCVGMNVAKGYLEDGKIKATSRELTYYLDPNTNEKLSHWINPWTGQQCPVVHIANDPVQLEIPAFIPLKPRTSSSKIITFTTEIPLFYPNPLYTEDGKFKEYDASNMYQAGEFFTFNCDVAEFNKQNETVDSVDVHWTRISQLPPFMKMGGYKSRGYMVFNCDGRKLPQGSTWKDLSIPLLVDELANVVPSYQHAPDHYDPSVKSISSWSYFKQHFDRYSEQPEAPWPIPEQQS